MNSDAGHYCPEEVVYYCYRYEPSTDDLARLLANRRHKDVEQGLMKLVVTSKMQKDLDTGIRVNPALASGMGVQYDAPDDASDAATKASLSTPDDALVDVKSPTAISAAERSRDKLFLVGVEM